MSLKVSRRRALVAGATVAAGVIGGNSWPSAAHAQDLGNAQSMVAIDPGVTLPAFRFFTANNTVRTLADYRGRGVVLNLWATWCGPCVAELPTMDRLAATLAPDGIVVLPVSSDIGGAGAVRAFYDSHDIEHLPILLDPGGAITQAWQVPGIPVTVIFDREGHPRARLVGGADWGTAEVADHVRSLCGPNSKKSLDNALSKAASVKI
jgi:peroxiredoxin